MRHGLLPHRCSSRTTCTPAHIRSAARITRTSRFKIHRCPGGFDQHVYDAARLLTNALSAPHHPINASPTSTGSARKWCRTNDHSVVPSYDFSSSGALSLTPFFYFLLGPEVVWLHTAETIGPGEKIHRLSENLRIMLIHLFQGVTWARQCIQNGFF